MNSLEQDPAAAPHSAHRSEATVTDPRTGSLLAAGITLIVFEAVGLLVLQPLLVMTMDIQDLYRTGNVLGGSILFVGAGSLAALALLLVVVRARKRTPPRDRPQYSPGFESWFAANVLVATLGAILFAFAASSIALSFGYLVLEDHFPSPIGRGPFWLFLGNMVAGPLLVALAALSSVLAAIRASSARAS